MDRDEHIDALKGFAIFLIVAGHIVPGIIVKAIFLFHVPLFFLISGYLHKLDFQDANYLKKKTISLLLPYMIYLFIFKAPSLISQLYHIIVAPEYSKVSAFLGYIYALLYGGELLKGTVGIFWFITCLFLTQQLFNFIVIRIKNKKVLISIAVLLYCAAFLNQISPVHFVFPWAANVVFCSFLFYFVGALYGDFVFKSDSMLLIFSAFFVSIISLILVVAGFNLNFDMKSSYYGWFIISPIAAIALSKIISLLVYIISTAIYLKDLLAYAGKASITIMFTHQYFHFRFDIFCKEWPWLMSLLIFIICCGLHSLFARYSVSRALLLGSRENTRLLQRSSSPEI